MNNNGHIKARRKLIEDGTSNSLIFQLAGARYSFGPRYGLDSCDTHDAGQPPYCDSVNASGAFEPLANPLWCSSSWCYVDPSNCNVNSTRSLFAGDSSSALFFSYPACFNENIFNSFFNAVQPRGEGGEHSGTLILVVARTLLAPWR